MDFSKLAFPLYENSKADEYFVHFSIRIDFMQCKDLNKSKSK